MDRSPVVDTREERRLVDRDFCKLLLLFAIIYGVIYYVDKGHYNVIYKMY